MEKIHIIFFTILSLIVSITSNIFGQNISGNNTTLSIDCKKDFDVSVSKLYRIIDSTKSVITYQRESKSNDGKRQQSFNISSNESGYAAINKKLQSLGYVFNYSTTTKNTNLDTMSISGNLNMYYDKKNKLMKILDTMNIIHKEYNNYWNQVSQTNSQITNALSQINTIKQQINRPHTFNINLYEHYEVTQESSHEKLSMVNMLGFGYSVYSIDAPKRELSNTSFMGPSVRYSISYGRMHLEMSLLQGKEYKDTLYQSAFNKILNIQFGQIFYPRYFGRGHLKFFNVFAGYDVGLMFASSEKNMNTFFQLSPNIGFELFKCKYLFIDAKAGYRLPFYNMQHLSGPFFSGSFNFIF